MQVYEVNFDGLVGPTHHYAGLALGNIASIYNALSPANPKAAALQGLAKMRFLHQLGIRQALIPPHLRPNLRLLHELGFTGKPGEQLRKAHQTAPELLSTAYSVSGMWTANSATVSASLDTQDGKVHFTAANLVSNLHRHQEAFFSKLLLKKIFADETFFHHHPSLPFSTITSDEGAANHNRLCARHNESGISLFVYGRRGLKSAGSFQGPLKYPARQTLEASEAIARAHQLHEEQVVFACQNPKAIDQGVFHNDVICVANESVLLIHEEAFLDQAKILRELEVKADFPINIIEVSKEQLTVADAVNSYLFNSQLITLPDDKMMLIAPAECQQNTAVKIFIDELITDTTNPIVDVHFLDLKQSMRNGGGPACLRLRVPLNEKEFKAVHSGVILNDELFQKLERWINKHYRDNLHADDLVDPQLIDECFSALDELSSLLNLGSIYSFQRDLNHAVES